MKFESVTQQHDKVIIIGGGESLTGFDFNRLNNFDGAIITVNNVIFHLPRVDYWITVDPMSKGLPQRAMRERFEDTYYYCAFPDLEKIPDDRGYYSAVDGIHYLERIAPSGKGAYGAVEEPSKYSLQEDKDKITTGDSVYGALGLAYHFEAKEIVLLGVDGYGYGHWYDKAEPYNAHGFKDFKSDYLDNIPPIYESSVRQFNKRGTRVINGSKDSIVRCFENMTPREAIDLIL